MSFFVGGRKRSDLIESNNMNSNNHNDWVQGLNIVLCFVHGLFIRMKIKTLTEGKEKIEEKEIRGGITGPHLCRN